MPNFKPKTKKKICVNQKSTITVDSKHNEKMKELNFIKTKKIPNLKKQKKKLRAKILQENILEKRLDLEDKLQEIKSEIARLKSLRKKYLLDNSKFIFDYFEKKKEISEGNNKTKILHSFFDNKSIHKQNNQTFVQKYLVNIDERLLDINNYVQKNDVCNNCQGELIPVDYEGVVICKECSQFYPYLIEHEKPSYKEPPKEVCFYAYKRINHFREILAQFQAKETTQIPDEVLSEIKQQIKKERIELHQMTNTKAKCILKKLGYNKYYEHIPFIKDKLGIKPPIMSPELEETLCNLFLEIQKPYAKHCPGDRVNFLNYYYVLYKMCELLTENKFLPYFPMLKDPVKRIEQDDVWKKICKELKWEFIPTV